MPPGLIEKNERMSAGRDRKRDFFEMKRHGLAVAEGKDEPGAFSFGRTDGTENIGRASPLIGGAEGRVPRFAQRRVILFFCPTRASS